MNNAKTESNTAVEALPRLVQLLAGLSAPEREKAISAAKILLAEPGSGPISVTPQGVSGGTDEQSMKGIADKAASWMRKNGLGREQLDQVFSVEDNTFDVIAAKMPGKSKRQQTLEAYILCGLKSFLQNGEPNFTNKESRELCQKIGCYDQPNHYNYIKAFGNRIGGSKDAGWKLTNPGLSEAARIVKELTEGSDA